MTTRSPSDLLRPNVVAAAGYVPGEQPTDLSVIKLNTNESPYPPSPQVMEALRTITPEQLRRYPSPSALPFREVAARVHGVTPDHILPFNGGDELLATVIRGTARESDRVSFLEPSYSLYPVLTTIHGATAVPLQYQIDGTTWTLPADIAATDAALLLIVNPNAPSGTFESPAALRKIAEQFAGLLVIDEAYVDFAAENCLQLAVDLPNVLVLRTMSKGYGLAGLRFGYAVAQPALLKQLEKVRDSYPCDAISIALAAAALADQPYAKALAQKVISERARVTQRLRQMGFTLPDSQSNFVLATVPAGKNGRSLYETLKANRILVRWWDLPRIADKLRITIGTPEQNDALLAMLATLIA
jgi:histidinol-phosphate aminotransferase